MRLADIGGMEQVKQRLTASFLEPLRNPEIGARFGKSLRGGLLLWGPPGCGKTFIARALAGELGASFLVVGLNDVLEMWVGKSEQNLHEVFEEARRSRPCVLFFYELDAIGQRRANLRSASATFRNVVNLFIAELDGADADNDGVFVLGATNHPWDVDAALMRPGRFDRTLLVLPPDLEARRSGRGSRQLATSPRTGTTPDVRRAGRLPQGRLDGSVEARRAVTNEPNLADRVSALMKLRKYADAAALARQGLATNPDSVQLNVLLSTALCQAGRYDDAVDAARRAVVLRPENYATQRTLGWATNKAGRSSLMRGWARSLPG